MTEALAGKTPLSPRGIALGPSPDSAPYTGPVSWAGRGERVIAVGRALLAVSALVTVWLDPEAPNRYVEFTYTLLAVYAVYAIVIAAIVWYVPRLFRWFGIATHLTDLVLFTVFIAFTDGVTSPLFAYFVFATVCGAIRWQWKGALWTAMGGLTAFIGLGVYAEYVMHDPASRLDRYTLRAAYLVVVAGILTYLGAYEQQIRQEIQRLARWPRTMASDLGSLLRHLAENAAHVLDAPRAIIVWHPTDSPVAHVELWGGSGPNSSGNLDGRFMPLVAADLAGTPFLGRDITRGERVLGLTSGVLRDYAGSPLNVSFVLAFHVASVLGLPLEGASGAGWLLCLDKRRLTSDDLQAGTIAAREVVAAIEQFNFVALTRTVAVQDARTRLGRDLHDGLLQSLTAARLQLHQLSRGVDLGSGPDVQARMSAIETTLAANQRELRLLVEELRHPQPVRGTSGGDFIDAIAALRRRMHADWHLDVNDVDLAIDVTGNLRRELVLLLQEALVNAARHGHATRAEIQVDAGDAALIVRVRDNGRGFGFSGRRSADELAQLNLSPASIRDRLLLLSGTLSVESSDAGACLEMSIPLTTEARVGHH
jgi:signal transduction histidine kinase